MYKGLGDKYRLGYQGDLGGFFFEVTQVLVEMTHTRDACYRVKQVKTNLNSFLYEIDWIRELEDADGTCKRGIGCVTTWGLMQGVWPQHFRKRGE